MSFLAGSIWVLPLALGILSFFACLFMFKSKDPSSVKDWRCVNYAIFAFGLLGFYGTLMESSTAFGSERLSFFRQSTLDNFDIIKLLTEQSKNWHCQHISRSGTAGDVLKSEQDESCRMFEAFELKIKNFSLKLDSIEKLDLNSTSTPTRSLSQVWLDQKIFIHNMYVDRIIETKPMIVSSEIKMMYSLIGPYCVAIGLGILLAKNTYTV